MKGKLTLHSYKTKPVKLSVRKSIQGEVVEASDKGKTVKLAQALSAVAPNSQVSWEFDLAPGAEKVLSYQYAVLLRR